MHWLLGWLASTLAWLLSLTGVTDNIPWAATLPSGRDQRASPGNWSTYDDVSQHGVYNPVRVFSAGLAGITCYRIPAAVITARGTLLAFSEARHGDCEDASVWQLALRRSTDGGQTWSRVTIPVGNFWRRVGQPYPIALANGSVALLFTKKHWRAPEMGYGNGIVFSHNDGVTWGRPRDITKDFGVAAGNQMGPGAGIELSNGRLLAVSHHGAYRADVISYSDDSGQTWQTIGQNFSAVDEGTLADLGRGEVILNMRHKQEATKGRAVSRSYDSGLTWTNMTFDKALKGPDCEGSLAEINGKLFFSNPANTTSRSHLLVRRSDDRGYTWRWHRLIQQEGSAGYSSLFNGPVGPGRGGVIYEAPAPGSIDFRAFSLTGEEEVDPNTLSELIV